MVVGVAGANKFTLFIGGVANPSVLYMDGLERKKKTQISLGQYGADAIKSPSSPRFWHSI